MSHEAALPRDLAALLADMRAEGARVGVRPTEVGEDAFRGEPGRGRYVAAFDVRVELPRQPQAREALSGLVPVLRGAGFRTLDNEDTWVRYVRVARRNPAPEPPVYEDFETLHGSGDWVLTWTRIGPSSREEVWELRVKTQRDRFHDAGTTRYSHDVYRVSRRGTRRLEQPRLGLSGTVETEYSWQLRADEAQLRHVGMAEFLMAQQMAHRMGEIVRERWARRNPARTTLSRTDLAAGVARHRARFAAAVARLRARGLSLPMRQAVAISAAIDDGGYVSLGSGEALLEVRPRKGVEFLPEVTAVLDAAGPVAGLHRSGWETSSWFFRPEARENPARGRRPARRRRR